MAYLERRLKDWYDIQEPVAGPVTLTGSLTIQMSTPTLTLTYPGTNTVSIQLTSSAQKLVTSWGLT